MHGTIGLPLAKLESEMAAAGKSAGLLKTGKPTGRAAVAEETLKYNVWIKVYKHRNTHMQCCYTLIMRGDQKVL